jgi:hypothetical protein
MKQTRKKKQDNKKKIPGFTAETSLYKSVEKYNAVWTRSVSVEGRVTPQLRCDCGPYTGLDGETHLACYCF